MAVITPLLARNAKSEPESVRYQQINALLLNEFLKEHRRNDEQGRKIQEQETTIVELRSGIRTLVTRLNDQSSQLQIVRAQLQTNDAAVLSVAENP